ncbi:ATP-binding protein [Nonomuraea sp. NPDC050394]|uniref:ATP-binding protein n=1 Tax=Nonomuraea sp. NPDC050394 TaxID=3364363 RepID=UPI0037B4FF13
MNERTRLTASFGGLLLLAGGGLVALIYFLLRDSLVSTISSAAARQPGSPVPLPGVRVSAAAPSGGDFATTVQLLGFVEETALDRLLLVSIAAAAGFALASVVLAWWMAGRMLRPVSVITRTARRLSGSNLHERIALDAPPGELKQLADTFDAMLDRIERLVGAQQRFAANAAHELRTQLAMQRAAAEIGLAGEPDAARVSRMREKLIDLADGNERLIEGLLLLSVSEQGLERREPVAVHHIAAALGDDAGALVRGGPLVVKGDPVLLERLVGNLVANAVRYNRPDGRVEIVTGPGELAVTNTGPVVPAEVVPLLFEPFRRLHERRHTPGEGAGLGLSIVAAVARAHDAVVAAEANPGGGLTVRVTFGGASLG